MDVRGWEGVPAMSYYQAGEYYAAGGFWKKLKRLGRVIDPTRRGSLGSLAAGFIPGVSGAMATLQGIKAAAGMLGTGGTAAAAIGQSTAGTPGHNARMHQLGRRRRAPRRRYSTRRRPRY